MRFSQSGNEDFGRLVSPLMRRKWLLNEWPFKRRARELSPLRPFSICYRRRPSSDLPPSFVELSRAATGMRGCP